MHPQTWQRAKELIGAALERPRDEREAFIVARCSDRALRDEILSMVNLDDGTGAWQTEDVTVAADLPVDSDDLPIGTAVGPYIIMDTLGVGGMGRVFLGRDDRLRRRVALKSLLSSKARAGQTELARILREARAAAQISHPNVATIHDVLEHDHRAFIVMEYVEGESLSALLRREAMSPARVISIGRQLAAALAAAHAKGVIHRDLKPRNIQVMPGDQIKVLDFGVAATTSAFPTMSGVESIDETGMAIIGTRGYMAPEQLTGRGVDERSDVFCLGIVLFEMATREKAFRRTDWESLREDVMRPVRRADRVNRRVTHRLADIIARALEVDPVRRFQTAAAVGEALTPLMPDTRPFWRRITVPQFALWLTGVVALFELLGFVSTAELDLALGRTGTPFAVHSPLGWFVAGVRALITPVVLALISLIVWRLLIAVWRLVRHVIPSFAAPMERVRNAIHGAWRRATGDDASTAAMWVLLTQAVAFGACVLVFRSLLDAIGVNVNLGDIRRLRAINHDDNPLMVVWYTFVVSLVLIGFGTAWYRLMRSASAERIDRFTVAAGLGLSLLTLLLLVVPHGLFYNSRFTRTDFDGERCYATGQDATQLLLFCPDSLPPRNRTVPRNSPKLVPLDTGYIFTWHSADSPPKVAGS
jgi:hypothetical protein